jgi:hypothetical protein
MKKSLVAALVAVVLVGVVGATGAVFAQSSTTQGVAFGQGFGYQVQAQVLVDEGLEIYHDEIMTTFADALEISIEDLEARIDGGETLVQIALSEGMTFEEIKALMPVGGYGVSGQTGIGTAYAFNNGEFSPAYFCDGNCLADGEYVPQYLGPQAGTAVSRGGRW